MSAFTKYTTSLSDHGVLHFRELIKNLTDQQKKLILQWISPHLVIENKAADILANIGAKIEPYSCETNYTRATTKIKDTHHKNMMTSFLMTTKRDRFAQHLHHIDIFYSLGPVSYTHLDVYKRQT